MELTALELLRQHTREPHARLEQHMHVDRIMAGTLQRQELAQLLRVNAHFLEAVERNASRFPELEPFVVPRAELALEDLRTLEAEPLPTTSELDTWTVDELRGALYVALGSLLGGAVIASKLKDLPDLPADQRFYALDKEALAVWREYLAHLGTVEGEDARNRLVRGAQRTFAIATEACAAASAQQTVA